MSWSGLPAFLEDKIIPEPNSGCWLWLGGRRDRRHDYGTTGWNGKTWYAHRLVFTLLRYELPKNMLLDHLCRTPACCNPDHLEPCTSKINIHRGEGVASKNLRKTHCPQGHEYTSENTYEWKDQRFCRACHHQYSTNYARGKSIRRKFELGMINLDPEGAY